MNINKTLIKLIHQSKLKELIKITAIIIFILLFLIITNGIPEKYQKYLSTYYIQLGLLLFICMLWYYNKYIGILGFILFTIQFRTAYKESFKTQNIYLSGKSKNLDKINEVDKDEYLKFIKAKLNFDQSKSKLAKQTILDIYDKYLS